MERPTIEEMHKYGYTKPNMQPISYEEACERVKNMINEPFNLYVLFDQNFELEWRCDPGFSSMKKWLGELEASKKFNVMYGIKINPED